MKNLNLRQKHILLVGVGIIVLMGLFPSWVCGTQTKAPPPPPKQQTREAVRAQANHLAAGQGLDMREGSPDHRAFWQIVDNGGLPQELDGKPFNKLPFEEQVKWAVNKVKAGRPGAPPVAQASAPPVQEAMPQDDYEAWKSGLEKKFPAALEAPVPPAPTTALQPGTPEPPLDAINRQFGIELPTAPQDEYEAWKRELEKKFLAGSVERSFPGEVGASVKIILLILVILSVGCLIYYFKPQLTVWVSQKPEQKEFEPIEKQEREVAEIPVEGKDDKTMKNLNLMQKRIMLVGVGIIILMGLIPPWSATTQTIHFDAGQHKALGSHAAESAAGYHFIFFPPRKSGFSGDRYYSTDSSIDYRLDFGRLFIQWFFVSLSTAALMFYFKE